MLSNLLRTGLLATAALAASSLALAQQPSPPPEPQQKQQQEQSQHTPSGKAGKEEPSSHAPTPPPTSNEVLVNGALNVPGAPTNSDTVPSKFSEENAADDKLITVAYTFKTLTEEQRQAIYRSLKGQSPATAFNANIGTELPLAIELRPVPDQVASQIPQTRGYQYAIAANQVLLVSPANRVVVGAFSDAK